ncbi:MAG: hypothetical protein QM831_16630 [Kofleriaceae bacterium]
MGERPQWVVIGKMSKREAMDAVDDRRDMKLVAGAKRGMYAIACYEGSGFDGEKLAKACSKKARAYNLNCDWESAQAETWDDGERSGDLFASVDAIASTLGFVVPGLDRTKEKAKLDPENAPDEVAGEWTFDGRTVAQWRYAMRSHEWSVMLEVTHTPEFERLLDGLRHADPKIRALCIELARAAGTHLLDAAAEPIADQLLGMPDPDAKETGQELADALSQKRYEKKYPFLKQFHAKDVAKALKLLDSEDAALRETVLGWFVWAHSLTATQTKQAIAKIETLAKTEGRTYALKHLKMR